MLMLMLMTITYITTMIMRITTNTTTMMLTYHLAMLAYTLRLPAHGYCPQSPEHLCRHHDSDEVINLGYEKRQCVCGSKITFHSPSSQSSTGLMRQENLGKSVLEGEQKSFRHLHVFVHDSIILLLNSVKGKWTPLEKGVELVAIREGNKASFF